MLKKIRILQFLSTSEIGGTEKMVLSLIKGMDKAIFSQEVCFLSEKGQIGDLFEKEANVFYLNYGKVSIFKVIKRLFCLLKNNKYDIIHIYGFRANILGRIIARFAGCKRIIAGLRSISIINTKGKFYAIIGMLLDRLTFPLVKLCISNSRKARDFLIKNGYPSYKFRVVYNGIDPLSLDFTPDTSLKEELGNKTIIISVANLSIWKDHKTLIHSLSLIKDKLDFKCLLVGDGPLREELIALVNKLSLAHNVIFLGKKDSIGNLLAISDIFVLTSIVEGLPVSIMEACLARLPIIATNVGGIPELVIDGETGILVPPSCVRELAKAIETLLLDQEKRRKMGEAGYHRIKSEFSLEKMINGIGNIYLELMEKE